MKPSVVHIVGHVIRNGEAQRKLNEKFREGYTLFSTRMLEPKKGTTHAGVLVFALELNKTPVQHWRSREMPMPEKWKEEYARKAKTKKGRS